MNSIQILYLALIGPNKPMKMRTTYDIYHMPKDLDNTNTEQKKKMRTYNINHTL